MINIIKDTDLINHIFEYEVILVGTSINNALGNGFQKKIAKNFPEVNRVNKSTNYGDNRKLGTVKVVLNKNILFCLCYINKNNTSLYLSALEKCLNLIASNFKDKKIASTIMGASPFDGKGDKGEILKIYEKIFKDADIDIYDYEQIDYRQTEYDLWNNLKDKKGEEYDKLKKDFFWNRAFGELISKPDNYEEMTEYQLRQYIKENKE